ncbi:MAG: hypothetical protein HKN13_03325 [Rhodothermales bacterium]|nr:hypothetical protein [Rhodothermales bacterium]
MVDGGFVANNPTLFAITDALGPLGIAPDDIRVLSLGTGNFPSKMRLASRVSSRISSVQTFMTLLKTGSNTVEELRGLIFGDVQTIRIDDVFADEAYRTDFVEANPAKLKKIFQLGRKSFEGREQELRKFFEVRA